MSISEHGDDGNDDGGVGISPGSLVTAVETPVKSRLPFEVLLMEALLMLLLARCEVA